VARALLRKGHPVLVKYGDERYLAGEEKGRKDREKNAARKHIHLLMIGT
jgi:hypothetical protein